MFFYVFLTFSKLDEISILFFFSQWQFSSKALFSSFAWSIWSMEEILFAICFGCWDQRLCFIEAINTQLCDSYLMMLLSQLMHNYVTQIWWCWKQSLSAFGVNVSVLFPLFLLRVVYWLKMCNILTILHLSFSCFISIAKDYIHFSFDIWSQHSYGII